MTNGSRCRPGKPHIYRSKGEWVVVHGIWRGSAPTVRAVWNLWRTCIGVRID